MPEAVEFLSLVFFVNHSVEYLNDLNYRDDKDSESQGNSVFCKIKLCEVKRFCKEWNLDNNGGENEGKKSGTPEPEVLMLHFEN